MFLRAVELIIQNVRAERNGLWSVPLYTVSQILPYFHVTNKVNYSRWIHIYILDMIHLPVEIDSAFLRGEFAIRQTAGTFNGVWNDMATEKTVIKDSKGCGGIAGITRQKSAPIRWSITRHMLGHFSSEMRKRSCHDTSSERVHEETQPTSMKRHESHVMDIIHHIQDKMTDPFQVEIHPTTLINISTGMHASTDVQRSLLNSVTNETNMVKTFGKGTLSSEEPKSLHSPIPRSRLKTLEDLTKSINLKCRSGDIAKAHINPELIFRRALVLVSSRDDVAVEQVLSYPIGPIPTSLFHDDGTMRKTCKVDLAHHQENEVSAIGILSPFNSSLTCLIRDGMAMFQALNVKSYTTFGDLASAFVKHQLNFFTAAHTVIDLFDRYDIKN